MLRLPRGSKPGTVFAEHGLDGATMRAVAAARGCTAVVSLDVDALVARLTRDAAGQGHGP